MLDSVVHLGSYLTVNLSDDLDIRIKTMDFIRQANAVLLRFHFADRALKTHLFRSYCLGLYGGALWNLSSGPVQALEVSYNNILCRIWSLPRTAHTAVIHSVAELKSVFNLLYCRFLKLVSIALNHNSLLVQSVLRFSIQSCSNFIGYFSVRQLSDVACVVCTGGSATSPVKGQSSGWHTQVR